MTRFTKFLAAAAAIGGLSAPAAAQYYQQPTYPQATYPQQAYPQPGYGQPGYGYAQPSYGYGQPGYNQGYAQNPVSQIINGLLGNRYSVTDRQAVSQCASAAMTQAAAQYGNGYNNGYGQGYGQRGYGQGYNHSAMRVTSITDVQRRNNGLRVTGLMSSGANYRGQYGNPNGNYAMGDVSFRCNVDYRGAVTNIRIGRNTAYNR